MAVLLKGKVSTRRGRDSRLQKRTDPPYEKKGGEGAKSEEKNPRRRGEKKEASVPLKEKEGDRRDLRKTEAMGVGLPRGRFVERTFCAREKREPPRLQGEGGEPGKNLPHKGRGVGK